MKILLINPPIQYALTVRGPNRVWAQHELAPPLGLMSLSSYLKQFGYTEIKLINGQTRRGFSDRELMDTVRDWRPDLVGFSVNTLLYYNCCRLAGLVKQVYPETKVVFGGPHLTEYGAETVSQPMVDFGVVGEGEYPLLELLEALEGKRDFGEIQGLVWKRGEEVIKNPPRIFTEPLDALPLPDHDLFDIKQHRMQFDDVAPTGIIITSRGCPYHCTFCSLNYPYYRARSAASVVFEMDTLKKMGYRSIDFFDDNFNVSRRRVLEICEMIRERNIGLPWSFRGRVDKFDQEQAAAAAAAGCIRASFGVESGNQQILDRIRKQITLAQVRSAFLNARKFGIQTVAYFMLGLPGETKEQAKQTLELIFEVKPDYVVIQALIPVPGSQIYRDAIDAGAFPDYALDYVKNPGPELFFRSWETGMTESEVFNLIRYVLIRFYFRPSYLLKTLTRIRSFENFVTKSITAARILLRMA